MHQGKVVKQSIRIRIRHGRFIVLDSTAGYLFYAAKYTTEQGNWFTLLDGTTSDPNLKVEIQAIEIRNDRNGTRLCKLWGRISGKKSKTDKV